MPNTNNKKAIVSKLNDILEMELSGVPRYLHYSLMIYGPNRIPIVSFFRGQANEALNHASIIGEKITAFGSHPSLKVKPVPETNKHGIVNILQESLEFEKEAVKAYQDLLSLCAGDVALEEMAREFIRTEQEHIEEVEKMIRINPKPEA